MPRPLQIVHVPTGLCDQCGVAFYGEPHNHTPIKTLSPEEAVAHWRERGSQSR